MRIGIAGSSGLIGSALIERLEARGDEAIRLHRGEAEGASWRPDDGWVAPHALEGCDAVVHLGGASIGEGRWTGRRKKLLRSSRIDSTRLLVEHLASLEARPSVFVCASAVGFYGDRGNETLDERAAPGEGFLADLVQDWEAEARRAEAHGIRSVQTRFGVVLDADEGALPRMVKPIRMGVGGRLGHGRQWMPWVTAGDAARAIAWTIDSEVAGPVNVTAPEAVTNLELTSVLGQLLHRPTLFPVPRLALRLLIGQAADELLMASTRAEPRVLEEGGFRFDHPDIETALRHVLSLAPKDAPAPTRS